jgi:hypothetical protein
MVDVGAQAPALHDMNTDGAGAGPDGTRTDGWGSATELDPVFRLAASGRVAT